VDSRPRSILILTADLVCGGVLVLLLDAERGGVLAGSGEIS